MSKLELVKAPYSVAVASSPSFTHISTAEYCDIISRALTTSVSADAHKPNISRETLLLKYSFEKEVKRLHSGRRRKTWFNPMSNVLAGIVAQSFHVDVFLKPATLSFIATGIVHKLLPEAVLNKLYLLDFEQFSSCVLGARC